MKKILSTIFIVLTLTIGIGGSFAVPSVAHAACNVGLAVVGNGLTDCIAEGVILTVMPIIGKFLQLTAYLFDQALVLNMNIAKYVQSDSTGLISPVEIVWRMIRDISGMFFIFVLIWASIKMILSGEASKGVIVGIVIAGLTVNFSLFLTKLVIDASNAMTLTIYTAIAPTAKPSFFGNASTDINGQVEGGVSSKIMEVVNLQSLFAGTQKAITTNFNVSSIVVMVGGISLMLVLGIAFLAAGVMFLWRFVMLLALMAFSPLPALAYAFPDFSEYGKKFTKRLIDQCLFAPIFLFFIYIALKVLTNPSFIALSGSKNSTFANVFLGGGIAPLIQYGLVIFIIFSGLGAASHFGAKGGEFGVEWMKGLGKWGQGAIKNAGVGSAKFVGRNTVGATANKISETNILKDAASKSTVAALALKGFKGVGASYKETSDKKATERVKFAESLGYNKNTVDNLQDKIFENERLLDGFKKSMAQPNLSDAARAQQKINIDMKEKENRALKKRIGDEKLRRQSNVARRDDPRLDLETGESGSMSIGQRINRFGFISREDEESTAQLGVKNLEIVLKEKEDALKKLNDRRAEIKKTLDKRANELKKQKKAKKDFYLDPIYKESADDLYELIRGIPDGKGGFVDGILDHEAEIRKFKNTLAKLK